MGGTAIAVLRAVHCDVKDQVLQEHRHPWCSFGNAEGPSQEMISGWQESIIDLGERRGKTVF